MRFRSVCVLPRPGRLDGVPKRRRRACKRRDGGHIPVVLLPELLPVGVHDRRNRRSVRDWSYLL